MTKAAAAMNDIEAFVDMFSTLSGLPSYKVESWLEIYWKLRILATLEEEEKAGADGRMVSAPTAEIEAATKPALPEPEEIPTVTAEPKQLSGNGARRKREILARLQKTREAGVRAGEVVKASGGRLTEGDIYSALQCLHLHTSKWEQISAALEKLGY